jgi:drug/metabolite transporter (DMT)-like permease
VTLLTYEANQRMGPTVTGSVGSTAPLFAAAAAVLFLGERLTLPVALATVAIVAGVATLVWQPRASVALWPRRLLLLPLAAAALRGLAHALIKLGLTLWPSPFAASLIGYTVSAAAVTAGARWKLGTLRPGWNRPGVLWFALVGLCNGAAVLAMYAALNRGPVTLVAPTVATYPLFALLFGALLLRGESVTARSAAGVGLTVAGVAALLLAR